MPDGESSFDNSVAVAWVVSVSNRLDMVKVTMKRCTIVTTKRGREAIVVDSARFVKGKVLKKNGQTYWKCPVRTCMAKVFTNGPEKMIVRSDTTHNHPILDTKKLHKQKIIRHVKQKAEEEINAGPAWIISSVLEELGEDPAKFSSKDINSLRTIVYQHKQRLKSSSKTLTDLSDNNCQDHKNPVNVEEDSLSNQTLQLSSSASTSEPTKAPKLEVETSPTYINFDGRLLEADRLKCDDQNDQAPPSLDEEDLEQEDNYVDQPTLDPICLDENELVQEATVKREVDQTPLSLDDEDLEQGEYFVDQPPLDLISLNEDDPLQEAAVKLEADQTPPSLDDEDLDQEDQHPPSLNSLEKDDQMQESVVVVVVDEQDKLNLIKENERLKKENRLLHKLVKEMGDKHKLLQFKIDMLESKVKIVPIYADSGQQENETATTSVNSNRNTDNNRNSRERRK